MPFGTKRRVTGNVAGRYLAAIGAGTCGEMEDATLSPVGECASADPCNSNAMKNNPLAIRAQQHYDEIVSGSIPAAPKTPTRMTETNRRSSFLSSATPLIPLTSSPGQELKMQPSPSAATATTIDAFSQSWATSSSPTSRKSKPGTPSRSPLHFNQNNNPNEKKSSTNFFSIFPTTKIALRTSSHHQYQKQKEPPNGMSSSMRMSAALAQPPPPPPPPPPPALKRVDAKGGSSSTAAWDAPPNQPQHLLPEPEPNHPDIELIYEEQEKQPPQSAAKQQPKFAKSQLLGRRGNNLKLRASPKFEFVKSKFGKKHTVPSPKPTSSSQPPETDYYSAAVVKSRFGKRSNDIPDTTSSAATSDVFSDIVGSEGAPTEVMTNRTNDRRYIMDPSDALWRKKKAVSTSSAAKEDGVVEEKKQDSDTDSPKHQHSTQQSPQAEQVPPPLATMTTTSEEDLLLFGPVPLERINTRRTSNRGKFNQKNPGSVFGQYGQPFQTIAAQYQQRRSEPQSTQAPAAPQSQQSQPQSSPNATQHRSPPPQEKLQKSPPYYPKTSPKSSPRLNRHLSKSAQPIDTKSLLSESTNDSSSGVSPPSLLNPILDQAGAASSSQTNDNNHQRQESSNHWWSAANVKITPKSSPVSSIANASGASSPKKKAVVAYPDSPPSYLKKVSPAASPFAKSQKAAQSTDHNKKDESFETHKSDLGVIGLDDGDEDLYGPMPKQIPKLAPCKQDPHKKKTPPRKQTIESPQKHNFQFQMQTPKVQLKPRKNRASAEMVAGESDGNTSIVSESSAWSPLAMSDHGLNFSSAGEKDVPLLPLFSQDRFEFFRPDDGFPTQGGSTKAPTTKLKMRVDPDREATTERNPGGQHSELEQEQQLEKQGLSTAKKPSPIPLGATTSDRDSERKSSRPSPSPEIWRRGETEVNSMASPDPIFCTQPSVSQPPPSSTMASSIVFDDSVLSRGDTQSPMKTPNGAPTTNAGNPGIKRPEMSSSTRAFQPTAKPDVQARGIKGIQPATRAPNDATGSNQSNAKPPAQTLPGRQGSVRRWPKVKTHFDGNSNQTKAFPAPVNSVARKLDPPEVGRDRVDPPAAQDLRRLERVPKRSISGPVIPMRRPFGPLEEPTEDDLQDVSSRQVETGADNDLENSVCSTGSLPRRAKSEQVRGNTRKASSPLRGSFKAAFAAFEKASAGRYKAYVPESEPGIDKSNSFASSRLAMVLDAHLAIQASESLDNPSTLQADTISVDVQSIRSNFEGVAPIDDDDDNASVKSLREVFETAPTNQPETAVSKMRALFENKKAPTAKNFESGSPELREVWNRFESNSPLPRPPSSAKKAKESNLRTRPSSVPNLRYAGQHSRPMSAPNVTNSSPKRASATPPRGIASRFQGEPDYALGKDETLAPDRGHPEQGGVHRTSRSPAPSVGSAGHWQSAHETKYPVVSQVRKDFGTHGPWTKPMQNRMPQMEVSQTPAVDVSHVAGGGPPPPVDDPQQGESPQPPSRLSESSGDSIPSDRQLVSPATDAPQGQDKLADIKRALTGVSASSDDIVSPPRLGRQTDPSDTDRFRKDYLPKDFTPTARASNAYPQQAQHASAPDKETVSASEGEFSDGVTLDLSIAEVSQLTNPTAIQSKAGDDSTLGDVSAGEKTVEIDLLDCEAKRSEASSSQQTEAAAPLIARALKRLSDDLSLESRNQIAKLWEKSSLLGDRQDSQIQKGEFKSEEPGDLKLFDSSGWDLRRVEASFPTKAFPSTDPFFGFDEDSGQEWQSFEKGDLWPSDPFSTSPTKLDGAKNSKGLSSGGPSRDPDGFHFDGQMNTSVHITEASTPPQHKFEDDSRSAPSDEAETRATRSPPRTYDTRSRVYTQAKKHAKAMLAARSPTRRPGNTSMEKSPTTPTRETRGNQSPRSVYSGPGSRATSMPSRPVTPPRHVADSFYPIPKSSPTSSVTPPSRSPNSIRPVSILRSSPTRPGTPPSRSPPSRSPPSRSPPSRSPPSSQPVTPTQRAVTPTTNNLNNNEDADSHVTPKVSHRWSDVHALLPKPPKVLLDAYPDPWRPQNGVAEPSQLPGEFKFDDSFQSMSPARLDFFSEENGFSLPMFEATKSMAPPPPRMHHAPRQMDHHAFQSSAPSTGRIFSRTYPSPTTNETLRHRKHSAEAHVRSFRTSPPRSRPEIVASKSEELTSGQLTPKATSGPASPKSSPGGRLASVVGKHAALIARLKVLKAARMRRSGAPTSSPHQDGTDAGGAAPDSTSASSGRPKSSIGRAIASVYRSRRNNSHNHTSYVQTKYGHLMMQQQQQDPPPKVVASEPAAVAAFDPFLANFPDPSVCMDDFEDDDDDDMSDSAGSSTRFGGKVFAEALEVD